MKEVEVSLKEGLELGGRVMKQNTGSAGEGIWIVKLNDKNHTGPIMDDTILSCTSA